MTATMSQQARPRQLEPIPIKPAQFDLIDKTMLHLLNLERFLFDRVDSLGWKTLKICAIRGKPQAGAPGEGRARSRL
jgi:hypothetical protein